MPAPRPTALPLLALCATLATAACGADAARQAGHTVTDSAGVRIVHSHRPAWPEEGGWRVAAEPRLRIGAVEGEEADLLHRIEGVLVLEDGGVAVANGGGQTIRFYDARGRLGHRAGGRGAGPGEFRTLSGLMPVGDEIWAYDRELGLRAYDGEGRLLRSVALPRGAASVVSRVRGVFGDGSLLMADWPQGYPTAPEPRVDSSTVVRADTAGSLDTLAVLPAMRYLPVSGYRFMTGQQFGPMLALAVHPDGFLHGFGTAYEIFDRDRRGGLRRILRRDAEPRPVTEAHREAYRARMAAMGPEGGGRVSPGLQAQRQALVDAQVYPEHHVPFTWMVMDRAGNVWARRIDPEAPSQPAGTDRPRHWDVFDDAGVWLGEVEVPGRLSVMDIGEDYIAGRWRDEMDVEYAVVFDLVKP